jgi:hypothetical protein
MPDLGAGAAKKKPPPKPKGGGGAKKQVAKPANGSSNGGGPLLKNDQTAGSPTKGCAAKKSEKPAWAQQAQVLRPKIHCDLQKINATLAVKGGPSVSVQNSRPKASAAGLPPGATAEEIALLNRHSVVITQLVPYTGEGAAGPSRSQALNENNSQSSREAKVEVALVAAEKCGSHPTVTLSAKEKEKKKDVKEGAGSQGSCPVKIENVALEVKELMKRILHGAAFADFVDPSEESVTFSGASCGAPSSGDPVSSLDAYVRLTALDEWKFTIGMGVGLTVSLSKSGFKAQEFTLDKDGFKKGAQVVGGEVKSEVQKYGAEAVKTERKVEVGSVQGSVSYHSGGSPESTDILDPSKSPELYARNKAATTSYAKVEGLFKGAEKLYDKGSVQNQMSLEIVRNGARTNTNEIKATVAAVQSFVETAMDLVRRLQFIITEACKVGIPLSIAAEAKCDLKLFGGRINARRWPELAAPLKGSSYHLARSRDRWLLGLGVTLVDGSVGLKVIGTARFIHDWVASAAVSLDITIIGKADIDLDVSIDQPRDDLKLEMIFIGVATAALEATAVSFYAVGQAQAKGGVKWRWVGVYEGGAGFRKEINRLNSERMTVEVSFRKGNKIWEFFGGSGSEPVTWPEDNSPIVILKEDEFHHDFAF